MSENVKFKSSEKAKQFLEEGSILFEESKNFEALITLNKSLCFAENDLEIAAGFKLRSKVFSAIAQYEKSEKNRKQAEDCESLTKSKVEPKKFVKDANFFKLSYPTNPKNPSIVKCLKLCVDEKFGRHIVTTQKLNTGDIVIIEKPFHKSLTKIVTQGRCVNCFKSNFLDLLPCSSCTTVMFCSDECKKSAWESFHKFECSSIDDMTEDDSFLMMIQRSLFEILSICGSLENLEKLVEENPTPITAFDIDMNSYDSNYLNKKLILVCQSLECAPETLEDVKFAKSFVDYHEHVKEVWKTEKQRDFLIKFIVKFIGIMNRNAFKTHWPSPSSNVEEQGCAIFLTISMLSHSCSPNLFRVRDGENMVLIVRKPIKVNEQLFLAYQ